MCNRQFWAGLLVGINALGVGWFGGFYLANRSKAVADQVEKHDDFVEIRFRVDRSKIHQGELSPTQKGILRKTGNSFDLAIKGDGFFRIQLPNGDLGYVRRGNFVLNSVGNLMTTEGYCLMPEIKIPLEASNLIVDSEGIFSIFVNDGRTASTVLGQLELATFLNPAALERDQSGYFKPTVASGGPTFATPGEHGHGQIHQGYLEDNQDSLIKNLFNTMSLLAHEGIGESIKVQIVDK